MLLKQFTTEQKQQAKRKQRNRVIAEAEAEGELMPEINPVDVETAEQAGSIKVHVELPNGEIVSFRVKKRRLGATFDELCGVILQGVPSRSLTAAQLATMELQYEDKDGDMLVLYSSSDISARADVIALEFPPDHRSDDEAHNRDRKQRLPG